MSEDDEKAGLAMLRMEAARMATAIVVGSSLTSAEVKRAAWAAMFDVILAKLKG